MTMKNNTIKTKSKHKVKKATLREKLVKLALNVARSLNKQPEYVMSGTHWNGFVTPSVWMQFAKPERSKYVPHQGFQERWRRNKCQ